MMLHTLIVALPLKSYRLLAGLVTLLVETHLVAPTPTSPMFMHHPTPQPIASFIANTAPAPSASFPFSNASVSSPTSSFIILCLTIFDIVLVIHLGWTWQINRRMLVLDENHKKQLATFMANFESIAYHSEQINKALDTIEKVIEEDEHKLETTKQRIDELAKARLLQNERSELRMEKRFTEMQEAMQRINEDNHAVRMKDREENEIAKTTELEKTRRQMQMFRDEIRRAADSRAKECEDKWAAAGRCAEQIGSDMEALELATQKLVDGGQADIMKMIELNEKTHETTIKKLETELRGEIVGGEERLIEIRNNTERMKEEMLQKLDQDTTKHDSDMEELRDIQVGLAHKFVESQADIMKTIELNEKTHETTIKKLHDTQLEALKLAGDEQKSQIQALHAAVCDAEKKNDASIDLLTKKGDILEAELRAEIVGGEERLIEIRNDAERMRAEILQKLEQNTTKHESDMEELYDVQVGLAHKFVEGQEAQVEALEAAICDMEKRDAEHVASIELLTKKGKTQEVKLRAEIVGGETRLTSVVQNMEAKCDRDISQLRSEHERNHQCLVHAIEHAITNDREEWTEERQRVRVEMRKMRLEVERNILAIAQQKVQVFMRFSEQVDKFRALRALVAGLSKDVRECRGALAEVAPGRQHEDSQVKPVGLPTPSPSQSPSLETRNRKLPSSDNPQSLSVDSQEEESAFLRDNLSGYKLWSNARKEKFVALRIPDSPSDAIAMSPAVSSPSVSIPALPTTSDQIFLSSSSPYRSQVSLGCYPDGSVVSMGQYLPPLSQESPIPEAQEVQNLEAISTFPSFNNSSPRKLNAFTRSLTDIPCSTPIPVVGFSIDIFPPLTDSPPLSPSPTTASLASLCRLTPRAGLPDTIAGIGNESWAIAHETFRPLRSSGLGYRSDPTSQAEEKLNASCSIKLEEDTFFLDNVDSRIVSQQSPVPPSISGSHTVEATNLNIMNTSHEVVTDDELFWSCEDGSKATYAK